MSQDKTSKTWERKETAFYYVCIAAMITVVALFAVWLIRFNSRYEEMEKTISELTQHQNELGQFRDELQDAMAAGDLSTVTSPDALTTDQYLDFLSTQTTEHQAFIERERQFLIQMLAIILAGAGVALAFFNIKRKKDIIEMVDVEYRSKINRIVTDKVQSSLEKELGGEDRLQYLISAVEKEGKAKQKKICFIYQTDMEKLRPVIERFEEFFGEKHKQHVFKVRCSSVLINGLVGNGESAELKNANIVVYEVKKEKEEKGTDASGWLYKKIDVYCERAQKECLLYCDGFEIDRTYELTGASAPAKFISTLSRGITERLYNS